MTEKQIQAALDIFQNLRKARVHLSDEKFAEFFRDLINKSGIEEANHIADWLEKEGQVTYANRIRNVYNKERK